MKRLLVPTLGLLVGLGVVFVGPATGQQTGTIVGTITSGGSPLAGAMARAIPSGRRATAGADGRYRLAVAPGTYSVECRKPGYSVQVVKGVKVPAGGTVTADCSLAPAKNTEAKPLAKPRPEPSRPAEEAERRRPNKTRAKREAMPLMDMAAGAIAPSPSVKFYAFPSPPPPPADREGYEAIEENDFKLALKSPLNTFSIDVDTASYANVRRILGESRMPPKDAVRIEELINYFTYDYAGPKDDVPFAVHTEVSTAPWNPKHRLVHIGLQGLKVDTAALPPSNLVFLFDVSGSMNSPDKLP
ncbi:MAG: von Willebrand factor type A domain-containing protein, partial [Myxococcales bacterium]|nr:von Willebrand factor type A domain-containing protein [Myxococcales bacterium]